MCEESDINETFICNSCEHFKDYKCGKESDNTDHFVKMCELSECNFSAAVSN